MGITGDFSALSYFRAMSQLVVGVVIAIAAFILQEVVHWIGTNFLFRQRLTADLESIVQDFTDWQPPSPIEIGPSMEGERPQFTVAPIWDYGYEMLGAVYAHSSSLMPDLFVRVIHIYTACGRFDEIRCAYNKTIMEMIGARDKRLWIQVLNSQLKDMGRAAQEIVNEGTELLAAMRKHYWFQTRVDQLVMETRQRATVE